MLESISLLTVCLSPLLRVGLREVLSTQPGLRVCGEARTASEGITLLGRSRPDVVVVMTGCGMGDGLAMVRDILRRRKGVPVLLILLGGDAELVERAMEAGAHGLITLADEPQELLLAVAAMRAGSLYFSRSSTGGQLVRKPQPRVDYRVTNGLEALSGREAEVFALIGQKVGSKEIAARLHISVKTVETHRQRMKEKLQCQTAADLNRYAAGMKKERMEAC